MGNRNTSLRKDYAEAINQLGGVEVSKLAETYKELHDRGGKKGGLVDRNLFSEHFNVSPILSERLFDAFDRKKVTTFTLCSVLCDSDIVSVEWSGGF